MPTSYRPTPPRPTSSVYRLIISEINPCYKRASNTYQTHRPQHSQTSWCPTTPGETNRESEEDSFPETEQRPLRPRHPQHLQAHRHRPPKAQLHFQHQSPVLHSKTPLNQLQTSSKTPYNNLLNPTSLHRAKPNPPSCQAHSS